MPIIYIIAAFLCMAIYTILIYLMAEEFGYQKGKAEGTTEGKEIMLSSFQYGQNWKTTDNYQGLWK